MAVETTNSELFARYFDDIEVGDAFTTKGRTITEADLVNFAALTWDTYPLHVDAEWASKTMFGERIAHGMLVLSMGAGLVPFDPERVVALRRVRDVVFKRPVRFGDTITVDGQIKALSELDEATGMVSVALSICVEGRTVARATVDVIWARGERPAAIEVTAADALTCVPL
jgi:3-hydroxybutyryl-CoA dehydratase